MDIRIKRAYVPADAADGYRVFVDRLWPRGLSHEEFPYDVWDKEVAPSDELRHWFHADPESRWPEFARRYKAEIEASGALGRLRDSIRGHSVVTLLYGSHDELHNNAAVLRDALNDNK